MCGGASVLEGTPPSSVEWPPAWEPWPLEPSGVLAWGGASVSRDLG